jgi:hypothetical protein
MSACTVGWSPCTSKTACFPGCEEPQMMRSAGPQSSRTSHISRHGIDRLTASSSSGRAADSAASAPLPWSDASVACKHRHADGWSVYNHRCRVFTLPCRCPVGCRAPPVGLSMNPEKMSMMPSGCQQL